MDFTTVISSLLAKLDFVVMALIIAGGFSAKRYFDWLRVPDAWKTLIVGSVFCSVYAMIKLYNHTFTAGTNEVFFLSYVTSTSFYELLLKPFMKKFGGENPGV